MLSAGHSALLLRVTTPGLGGLGAHLCPQLLQGISWRLKALVRRGQTD